MATVAAAANVLSLRRLAALHRLDDDGWARHANPWSGWTRFATGLPLVVLAIWSRVWLGWWALVPLALVLLWLWANPRAFAPATSDAAWITKGVLGERIWVERDRQALPERHRRVPRVLAAGTALALPFLAWGLVFLEPWPTLVGVLGTTCGKLWFVDRMALLYDDMVRLHPELRYRPAADAHRPA
jgi:hypothetical protein